MPARRRGTLWRLQRERSGARRAQSIEQAKQRLFLALTQTAALILASAPGVVQRGALPPR